MSSKITADALAKLITEFMDLDAWAVPRTDKKGRAILTEVTFHNPLPLNLAPGASSVKMLTLGTPGIESLHIDYGHREIIIKTTRHGVIRQPIDGNVLYYKAMAWKDATPPAKDPP